MASGRRLYKHSYVVCLQRLQLNVNKCYIMIPDIQNIVLLVYSYGDTRYVEECATTSTFVLTVESFKSHPKDFPYTLSLFMGYHSPKLLIYKPIPACTFRVRNSNKLVKTVIVQEMKSVYQYAVYSKSDKYNIILKE